MRQQSTGDKSLVVNGLVHKRAQLAGEIARIEANLVRLKGDLDAVDRVLTMQGLSIKPEAIPPIVRPWSHLAKELAEMRAFATDMLSKSRVPLRNAMITRAWMEAHNIPGLDMRTLEYHRTRMGTALRYMRRHGKAEMLGKGLLATWKLTSAA